MRGKSTISMVNTSDRASSLVHNTRPEKINYYSSAIYHFNSPHPEKKICFFVIISINKTMTTFPPSMSVERIHLWKHHETVFHKKAWCQLHIWWLRGGINENGKNKANLALQKEIMNSSRHHKTWETSTHNKTLTHWNSLNNRWGGFCTETTVFNINLAFGKLWWK